MPGSKRLRECILALKLLLRSWCNEGTTMANGNQHGDAISVSKSKSPDDVGPMPSIATSVPAIPWGWPHTKLATSFVLAEIAAANFPGGMHTWRQTGEVRGSLKIKHGCRTLLSPPQSCHPLEIITYPMSLPSYRVEKLLPPSHRPRCHLAKKKPMTENLTFPCF